MRVPGRPRARPPKIPEAGEVRDEGYEVWR